MWAKGWRGLDQCLKGVVGYAMGKQGIQELVIYIYIYEMAAQHCLYLLTVAGYFEDLWKACSEKRKMDDQ